MFRFRMLVCSVRVKIYLYQPFNFILGFLTLVYIIFLMYTCSTLPPPPPPPSAQDYCLPVHRLYGGTGCPGSKCYPWHHRYKQGWHPRQHDLPRVSWTHSDQCDSSTTGTQIHICIDIVSVLCFALRSLSMVGLILIALGTGGIKPCVAAFGGDQFQDHQVRCQPSTCTQIIKEETKWYKTPTIWWKHNTFRKK